MHGYRINRRLASGCLAAAVFLFTAAIFRRPQEAYTASVAGLKLWWEVIFPTLLPFFILSELLMGLGVVHFLGALLEPLMFRVFRIPGAGGVVVALGLASGYPVGAKMTARLRSAKMLSQVEAERLVSFASTASPIFMMSALAAGMFATPFLGGVFLASHYLASFVLGFLMRFHGPDPDPTPPEPMACSLGQYIHNALESLAQAREEDGRPFGKLLGDAVKEGTNTVIMVGGFIILFSILVRLLVSSALGSVLTAPFAMVIRFLGFSSSLGDALVAGTIELTVGCNAAAQASAPMLERVVVTAFILSWGGLSVHAQIAAINTSTDIRYWPYVTARLIHGILSAGMVILFAGPLATMAINMENLAVWGHNPVTVYYLTGGLLAGFLTLSWSILGAETLVQGLKRSQWFLRP